MVLARRAVLLSQDFLGSLRIFVKVSLSFLHLRVAMHYHDADGGV